MKVTSLALLNIRMHGNFAKARLRDVLFEDWVVLFITPRYLWMPGTRFCPRNAAADYGHSVSEGKSALLALFADEVRGAYGKTFLRGAAHLLCCPTDEQAEVLIPDQIEMADILSIAIRSETQAKNEAARLRLICIPENKFKFVIAPDLFAKYTLSNLMRSGRRPIESFWMPRGEA